MANGLPWAKVSATFHTDPKWRRLERRLQHRDYLAAIGAWLLVLVDAWRAGSREGGVSAEDLDIDADLRQALEGAGLLDAEGRIPDGAWAKWGGATLDELATRAEQHRAISRLGGQARASGSRDPNGRFTPSGLQPTAGDRMANNQPPGGEQPAAGQPTGGKSPAVSQPEPAKIEIETKRESTERTFVPEVPSKVRVRDKLRADVRLTAAQHQAWQEFGPEWDRFRLAWLGRGLVHPPTPRQRELLWEILDARPTDLCRWVRDAPPELRTGSEVIGWVLDQWRDIAVAAARGERDEPPPMTPLKQILARLAT